MMTHLLSVTGKFSQRRQIFTDFCLHFTICNTRYSVFLLYFSKCSTTTYLTLGCVLAAAAVKAIAEDAGVCLPTVTDRALEDVPFAIDFFPEVMTSVLAVTTRPSAAMATASVGEV